MARAFVKKAATSEQDSATLEKAGVAPGVTPGSSIAQATAVAPPPAATGAAPPVQAEVAAGATAPTPAAPAEVPATPAAPDSDLADVQT